MNSTEDLGAFLAASLENLSEDPAEALQEIASIRDKLSRFATDDNYDNASKQLEAETHWRLGLLCLGRREFAQGVNEMQKARESFTHLGEEERATLAIGLTMYMSAIVESQKLNLAAGLELLKNAESQLSGTANPSLRSMLDHFAPEALFTAGVIALANLDLDKAQVLITDAAVRTEIVAKVYHDHDPSAKSWFLGLADLYRAYLGMSQLLQNLGAFDVEGLDQTNELGLTAQHARELLLRGEAPESIKQIFCGLASATSAVIDAVLVAAPVVDAMLKRKLPPAVDLVGSQNRLKQAKKAAAAGGESNLPLVRLCERLDSTIGNLQRYVHNIPVALRIPSASSRCSLSTTKPR